MTPDDLTRTHPPADPTRSAADAALDAGLAAAFGGETTQVRPSSADVEAGTVIADKYRLTEKVGEGGMGSVWVAHQTEPVKRKVAVKLIKAGMDSKAVLARFDAERQALAVMDHPNIAKVLDGGLHDGRPYFVMELVKGVPITTFCDERKLTPAERLELFVPVCQAIQHAHQKGVIHRDIKPSNVLVALYDDKPVVKVIDFGVAKATGAALTEHTLETGFGAVVGTPAYMSPEQASLNNLDIDTRSDVYSLGVLLYELLAGSPPFARQELEKRGLLEMLRVVREEEPPRPSAKLSTADTLPSLSANRGTEPKKLTGLLRNELDWIVMKALEKDRTRRYDTANGFAADVLRYLSGEPVQAHPPSAGYRLKKFARKHRGPLLAGALVLLALLAGFAGTLFGLVRADEKRREAEQARTDEAEQRAKAVTAGDRAADSDEFSRKTIDRVVDGSVRSRFTRLRDEISPHLFQPPNSAASELHTFRVFYDRQLAEHPTGERYEAAALRQGMVLAALRQRDEACRTLDRLIDTLTTRLTADPLRTADRRALAEALEVRARVSEVSVRFRTDNTPEPDDVRVAEADGPAYRARAAAEWQRLVADDPNRAEYRFICHEYQLREWRQLCALSARAEQVRQKRVPPPKDGFPPDLEQRKAAHCDRMFADLREAIAHFPDQPADAAKLRELVRHTALPIEGVAETPVALREGLLAALFNAELSAKAVPDEPAEGAWKDNRLNRCWMLVPDRSVTASLRNRDEDHMAGHRVAQAAWDAACRELPDYPGVEAFAVALRCEVEFVDLHVRGVYPGIKSVADEQRVAKAVAEVRKRMAEARSRPAASPFRDGRPVHLFLRSKLVRVLVELKVGDALDEFAAWKAEQPKPTTAELRDRLLAQCLCFESGVFFPSRVVSKEREAEFADGTFRDFEELFGTPGEGENRQAVAKYLRVAQHLASLHFSSKGYADAIRVARAAAERAERVPLPPNPEGGDFTFATERLALLSTVVRSHVAAKQHPEAVAACDEYLALAGKRNWSDQEQFGMRMTQAAAVLHQGKTDDAMTRANAAIRGYWDRVLDQQKSWPSRDLQFRQAFVPALLASTAKFATELRATKADAAFDRWAAEVQPLLDGNMPESTGYPGFPKEHLANLTELYRVRMWEVFEAGRTKDALAYADRILALKPEPLYAARIQMSRARMVAVGGDHAAGSKVAKALLDAPTAKGQTVWFYADAALGYAAAATACAGDDALKEKYAVEAVRLLRVCWEKEPKELPKLARFPEFRPHAGRDDYKALLKEIDAKFPPKADPPTPEPKK